MDRWLLIVLWPPCAWALELAEWVTSLGGFVSPKLEIKTGTAGRGLFVSQPVQQGETLLSIPFNAILLGEKAVNLTPCQGRISEFFDTAAHPENVGTRATFSIMVFLLHISIDPQARKAWPHLDFLLNHWDERQLSRFPLFWASEMLADIAGTTAFGLYSIARTGVERGIHGSPQSSVPWIGFRFHSQILQEYLGAGELTHSHLPWKPWRFAISASLGAHLRHGESSFAGASKSTWNGSAGDTARGKELGSLWPPASKAIKAIKAIKVTYVATEGHGERTRSHRCLWFAQQSGDAVEIRFHGPWIHNLTCLTKTRLSLDIQKLRGEGGGGGFPPELLSRLQPFLHLNWADAQRRKRPKAKAWQATV